MSELERAIRSYWSTMNSAERLFAMMDLGEEQGVEPISVDDWMAWMPQPRG
jgi:hypothetical protein